MSGRSTPARRGLLGAAFLASLLLPTAATWGRGAEPLQEARATASEVLVDESEWASQLVDVLRLAPVLPEEAGDEERFALLCAEQAELVVGAGGRRLPEESAFRVAVEAPRPRQPSEPVRIVVSLPATTLYQLTVEGVGLQRWVVDQEVVGHLDLSPLGVAQASAVVPLREGPHEVSAYLVPGARVDRIELAAYRPLCVAPADGWHAGRPLRFGAMARTVVRAFGFERRLPEREDEELEIEAERFDEVTAGGGRTHRRLTMEASGGAWASAASSPSEFTWGFELREPRVVTVLARTHGVLPQLWSLDGRYRITLHPKQVPGGFEWNHVITVPLDAGQHALRSLVSRGSGIDSLRIVHHRSAESDYVSVLEELGFQGGAPDSPVPRQAALDLLASPSFIELANGFRLRIAGDPRDRPLALVDDEIPPDYSRPLSPLLPAEL